MNNFDYLLFQKLNSLAGRFNWLNNLIIFLADYLLYFMVLGGLIYLFFAYQKKWKNFLDLVLATILSRVIFAEGIRFFYYRPRPCEMKRLVSQNVNYVVNVYGIENNKCHLSYKFIDQNEKLIANKKNLDCYVPLNNINLDMFDYLFTINQKDDNLISNQQKIETDYCNKL